MKKKYLVLSLALIAVVGSLFFALGSNMFFDDIFNIQVGFGGSTLVASLPSISVALFFVIAILYVLRMYKHRDCQKRLSRLYLIITLVLGSVGLLGAILAGATVYHTFVGDHPFAGYLIIFMILDVLLIGGAITGLVFLKKMPEDEGKIKITFKYVMKTIGWFLFICIVLNRFGMFLGLPTYVYTRNLYQTFPTYLWMLLPLFLGVLEVLYILGILDRKKLFILAIVGLGLNVCFFGYTAVMGINDTAFISSLSQIYPLERMASKPLEILIHLLSYVGVGIALLIQNKKPKEE